MKIIVLIAGIWLLALPTAMSQSFTGAEFGAEGEGGDDYNYEGDAGLNSATPSNDVDELGNYDYDTESGDDTTTAPEGAGGTYDDEVGNYGLGGGSNTDINPPGEYGENENIFGTQYQEYDAVPEETEPVAETPLQSTGTTTGTYNTATPPTATPPANTGATYGTAPTGTYNTAAPVGDFTNPSVEATTPGVVPVDPTMDPGADPLAAGMEDPNQYYPTEEAAPGPVAPPLPPPNEFSGAPPVPGSMRTMADGEAPEEYMVEPGDTLFDICDQLLDEAAYWPKLWSLNPEIKNPHFIYPGMKLRFYPGTEESPPYLQVVAEEDVIPIDKGQLDESALILEPIDFVADSFDEPVPIEVIGPDQVTIGDDVIVSGGSYAVPQVQMRIPGFVVGEEKEPLGYVLRGRQNEVGATVDTRLFVRKESDLSPGSSYSILRPYDGIENPESGESIGILYYWIANVKVERNVDEDHVAVVVTEGRLPAREGDAIYEFVSTKRTTTPDFNYSSVSSIDANIIAFGEEGRETGRQGGFAFVDAGTAGGISAGMSLSIYQTPRSFASTLDLDLPEDFEQVGVMRILDATADGAVGWIIQAKDAVRLGDRTDKG